MDMKLEKKKMRSIRFSVKDMGKIQKEATKQNRSFNNMVDTIIKKYIKEKKL